MPLLWFWRLMRLWMQGMVEALLFLIEKMIPLSDKSRKGEFLWIFIEILDRKLQAGYDHGGLVFQA